MITLIDETRDRVALASDDTRVRMAYASEGFRLQAEELLDLARTRLALVFGVLAALLAGGFLVAQGAGGNDSDPLEDGSPTAVSAALAGPTLVQERGYSLSLPEAWVRSDAPDGAVFAAESADGSAQATLWVERNRNLDFDGFVNESLGGLSTLGDDAKVVDRVDGPTIEASSAELRADVPLDGRAPSPYKVTLRAAGPYRYYLATTIQPGASPEVLADAELLGSSLRPEVRLEGVEAGG